MTVYGPDLDLANRLRQWLNPIGVTVVEIDGWQDRGRTYATFNPFGSVNHHTAGGPNGVAPSLGIVINGRSDLPGPLCNVHQQRDDVVNVVAAGVANHAGAGAWQGLHGNQTVHGLEVEHVGSDAEDFPLRRFDITCRVHAAFLSGTTGNADLLCEHYEWTPQKIDFWHQPGGLLRDSVRELLAVGPGIPAPQPPPKEHDMTPAVLIDKVGRVWLFIVGTDHAAWFKVDNGGWASIGGQFTSGLAVTELPGGVVKVIGRGTDGHPWSKTSKPNYDFAADIEWGNEGGDIAS